MLFASTKECDYVVLDMPRYTVGQAVPFEVRELPVETRSRRLVSAARYDCALRRPQATQELAQCRYTLRNFAWTWYHWIPFINAGILSEACVV